uniref:CHK kinase-like domain-containing protein n=1 Tax=Anopheles atroparvus TaxID=41427 RepID=A0A182IN65_ANOAO
MSPTASVPAYVQQQLLSVAESEGFSCEQIMITYEPGSKVGDGYIGQIVRVRFVSGNDPEKPPLTVICKFPPEDRKQREQFHAMLLFERELFIYRRILPAFEELQAKHGVAWRDETYFGNYPKCYKAHGNAERGEAVLILEDLTDPKRPGLKLLNQYEPVDYDHVRVLMQALGKLNACSFALKQHRPEVFEELRQLNDVLSIVLDTEQTRPLTPRNCRLAASVFDPQKEPIRHRQLLDLCDAMWPRTGAHIRGELAEPYAALNHGDCWTNNVMFGYDSEGRVNEVCLFDWQMARYSSPVLDYILFIFLCGQLELRREKFDSLLDIFYEAFSECLRRLGGDPDQTLPRKELEKQMKQFGRLALSMGTYALPNFAQLPVEICENPEKYPMDARLQKYHECMRELVKDTDEFDKF